MKRKLLSIVLSLCVILAFMPQMVFADGNGTYDELQNLLKYNDLVTLDKDYTISSTLQVNKAVILDLNGHVIKRIGFGSVIQVNSSGNLTLQDSKPDTKHTGEFASLPAGGVITEGKAELGGGVNVEENSSFTMTGGTIYNCAASNNGGGVNVESSSFTMTGGAIYSCSSDNAGCLNVMGSSFTMTGGTISGGTQLDGKVGVTFSNNNLSHIYANGGQIRGKVSSSGKIMHTATNGGCTEFYDEVVNTQLGTISGGIYYGKIENRGTISGGIFYDEVENRGTISGGIFYGGIEKINEGTVTEPYHTVSFNLNGGDSTVPATQYFVNINTAQALKPTLEPTNGDKPFFGWYNGKTRYDFTGNVTEDIFLKAQWEDIEEPVITGLEDNKTYCDTVQFEVYDNVGVKSVTANDVLLTPDANKKYTLEAGVGTVDVVVIDQSGIPAKVTVTVNDGHTGGEATCRGKAICAYCGEEYGEFDSSNHNLENIPAKAATDSKTGNIEYWHCKDCGKYFADENGTKEIELDDTVIAVNAWAKTVLRLQATATKTSIKLKWNAVPDADGYVIYWNKCGAKNGFKQVKVIGSGKTLTWIHKNLKKNTWNKYYVKAYKVIDGKKSFIKTSNKIHLVTKGGKYTNVKKLKSNVSGVTLNKGKTKALKITQIYVEKNKKIVKHMRPLTYTTSDKKVATVTSKGVIKEKGTGSCYIYITAHSGVYTRVKVTVK